MTKEQADKIIELLTEIRDNIDYFRTEYIENKYKND